MNFFGLSGGGLGNTRKGGADENTKYSGRDDFVGRDRLLSIDVACIPIFYGLVEILIENSFSIYYSEYCMQW